MPESKSAFADGASTVTRLLSSAPEFDELVFRSLKPLTVSLAVVFVVFVALGLIDGEAGDARFLIVATDVAAAVFFLCTYFALTVGVVHRSLTYPLGLVIASIPLINSLLAFWLTQNPFFLSYLPMIAIGCGAFMLSLPWLLTTFLMILATAFAVASDIMPVITIFRYLPALVGAFLVSILILVIRRWHVIESQRALLAMQAEAEERKRAEAHLAHAQRLESIGKLVSGIAHDFNNLLMVIVGYADSLLYDTSENSEVHEGLREIRSAGEKAALLASKLLAFSRQQLLQLRVVDLNALVKSAEQLIKRSLPSNVKLQWQLDPAAGRVRVDPLQMEQVLLNLALNARDAMADTGGDLTIETSLMRPADGDKDGQAAELVEIRVTDTGTGMTNEIRERAFEPFYTTKESGSGTGLGLAMVHGIVTQSGGSIEVETELGRGTSFCIRLARDDSPLEDVVEVAVARDGRPALAGIRVLLADDEQQVREIVSQTLSQQGCRVVTVESGEKALEAATYEIFDIVITDVVMPGMSGVELVHALHERGYTQPALLLSGHAADKVASTGVSTLPLLKKPFRVEELVRAVSNALSGP